MVMKMFARVDITVVLRTTGLPMRGTYFYYNRLINRYFQMSVVRVADTRK